MEAIIYLPGLGTNFRDQSVHTFALRYAKAIDINAEDVSKKYEVGKKELKYGINNHLITNVASIMEADGKSKKHIVDIFELDYEKDLTQQFRDKNIYQKTLSLASIIFLNFPKLIYYFFNRKKKVGIPGGNKLQFAYAGFIMFLMALFGLLLIAAFPATLDQFVDQEELPNGVVNLLQQDLNFLKHINWPDWLNFLNTWEPSLARFYGAFRSVSNHLIGFFALFYLFVPNLNFFVTEMVTEFTCMIKYLAAGQNRLNLNGKFEELLERVAEDKNQYDKITVIGYSFGTIIAIDSIFPMQGATSHRVAEKIDTLVTIGSPHDFVKLYWKRYYDNREFKAGNLKSWFNIYSTSDILSSNYRKDDQEGEAHFSVSAEGPIPTNIPYHVLPVGQKGILSALMLAGLKAHSMYWEDQVHSASCLSSLLAIKDK